MLQIISVVSSFIFYLFFPCLSICSHVFFNIFYSYYKVISDQCQALMSLGYDKPLSPPAIIFANITAITASELKCD